jgi:hypothetical protein
MDGLQCVTEERDSGGTYGFIIIIRITLTIDVTGILLSEL